MDLSFLRAAPTAWFLGAFAIRDEGGRGHGGLEGLATGLFHFVAPTGVMFFPSRGEYFLSLVFGEDRARRFRLAYRIGMGLRGHGSLLAYLLMRSMAFINGLSFPRERPRPLRGSKIPALTSCSSVTDPPLMRW